MLRCNGGTVCSVATFSTPPQPTWAVGQTVAYTVTKLSGGVWGYNSTAIPSWLTVSLTATEFTLTGTRPNSSAFTVAFALTSCGVTYNYLLEYPALANPCQACTFNLIETV